MAQYPRDPNPPPPQTPEGDPPIRPEYGGSPPPQGAAAPPPQSWQSTPQQPGPPPPSGGMGPGGPSWTANLTAQGTIAGPGGVALADLPSRVIAAVIDFVILGIIGFVVGAIINPILGLNLGFGIVIPTLLSTLVVTLIMLGVSAGYFIYTWMRMNGSTLGMRVVKLAVRDAASGGEITQQQAINRWLLLGAPFALGFFSYWGVIGLIISVLVLGWYIYLLVTMAQSATRQGFHDQYAKTVVAKVTG